jgi:hypothetical protein
MSSKSNNPWIKKIKECAKEYREEQKQKKTQKQSNTKQAKSPKTTKSKTTKPKSTTPKTTTNRFAGKTFNQLEGMEPPEGLTKRGYNALLDSKKRVNRMIQESRRNNGVDRSTVNNHRQAMRQIKSKLLEITNPTERDTILNIINNHVV